MNVSSAIIGAAGRATAMGSQHDRLVEQARVWVGQTFYGTLLKQMRDSPFRSELLDGGRGGQTFGAMFDQRLAERMAAGRAGGKLVSAIVKKIEKGMRTEEGVAKTRRGEGSRS